MQDLRPTYINRYPVAYITKSPPAEHYPVYLVSIKLQTHQTNAMSLVHDLRNIYEW